MAPYRLFAYQCARCGHDFRAPVVLEGYGVLGARSSGLGTLIRVDAIEDPVFEEVKLLGHRVISERSLAITERQRGRAIQAAWSVACDPDADGSPFVIDGLPHCPECGSEPARWTELHDSIELDLPNPTYSAWSDLNGAERGEAVQSAVMDALSS